jgi:hypothetical protein
MSNTALTVLVVLVALLSLVALATSLLALRGRDSSRGSTGSSPLPTDVAGLRTEVERVRSQGEHALRHLAVVRYDAFGDMGGRLSWSLALVDQSGNGVVLTSIHGRSEARTYAKSISAWSGDQQLSPEEEEALGQVKAN